MKSIVSGTGTTIKVFPATVNLPGTGRSDGKSLKVRASGYCFQNGTSGHVTASLLTSDPQYAPAGITASKVVSNVATFYAHNNFVATQKVTITGCSHGSVVSPPTASPLNVVSGTIVAAQSDQFTVSITTPDLTKAAEAAGAMATIDPVLLYASTDRAVDAGSYAPWEIEAEFVADSNSGTLQGTTHAVVNNLIDAEAAISAPPTGLSLSAEPSLIFSAAITFSVSNASNKAAMREFQIEEA